MMGVGDGRREVLVFGIAVEVGGYRLAKSSAVDEDDNASLCLYVVVEAWCEDLPVCRFRVRQGLWCLEGDLKALQDRGLRDLDGAR